MDGLADSYIASNVVGKLQGFKGYSVASDNTLAKNIVAKVQYFDLESKEGKADAETIWSQVVFTF